MSSLTLPTPRTLGRRPPASPGFPDSPQWRDGSFHNRLPSTVLDTQVNRRDMAREFARKGKSAHPGFDIPTVVPTLSAVAPLAATWLGHSTVLIEVDGVRVLADPVWSERCSPSQLVGPRRFHPVPIALGGLPDIDAVVISHDHYDHLDLTSIVWLTRHRDCVFVVPLGVSEHLRRWKVPEHRIVELDWDEEYVVPGTAEHEAVRLVCTEARHFSGRSLVNDTSLWSSWVVQGPQHAVFYGGDTGFTPAFEEIGSRFGGFDLSLLPIGAYDHRWPDIHLDPSEAIRTRDEMGGGLLLPVHWATFDLAFHRWAEPIERLLDETGGRDVLTPHPGERWTPATSASLTTWWR